MSNHQRHLVPLVGWLALACSTVRADDAQHWAFTPARRPPIPPVAENDWPRNPIDAFVLRRLEREGLRPSSHAVKETLVRRATLDLTGLVPQPADVDAFVADTNPHAYEMWVERLLASPRYGERMAVRWLEAARYADTSGYQNDGPRDMWRWRDWVIDAFNRNLPFDRFTIEQIAGDLLPNPTLEQRIATGFHRNHRGNSEGGIIPEEYAVEYVADRVDTTATVWLGLTVACARCHDHKYDPISQREFYKLFALFNNVPEHGRAIKEGNSPPFIAAPTASDREALRTLDRDLNEAQSRFAELQADLRSAQSAWESSCAANGEAIRWVYAKGLTAHFAFDGTTQDDAGRATDATFVDGDAQYVSSRWNQGASFDGSRFVDAGDVGRFGYFDKFSLTAWVRRSADAGGIVASRMTDVAQGDGYAVYISEQGHVEVHLVKRWLDDSIRVASHKRVAANRWTHLAVTYDGSRVATGIGLYIDGQPIDLDVHLDAINQSFESKEPLRIGGGGGPANRFRGAIDDVRIYDRCLTPQEVGWVATPETIDQIIARPTEARTPLQTSTLRACFLEHFAPEAIRTAHGRVVELRERRQRLVESFPTVMVMQEQTPRRDTYVLARGQYDQPSERVSPGVPAVFSPLPAGVPQNRLGLAAWLVDPANPLTARVAVNRLWRMFFGSGLVRTDEDFGVRGEPPSHPALLDWLAVEFIESGWDVKRLQRLIVNSATYRQSSQASASLRVRDPENRLLARGPRFRLPAEVIRDQALAAGGLLVERLGGPSVRPYQPVDLWKDIASDSNYVPDRGAGLFRRSLYTYWKRTVAPPTMTVFDAPPRETCTVRQARTNTPLQALALMNDVAFVEAARVLAQRAMIKAEPSPEAWVELAFRRVLARRPTSTEHTILQQSFRAYREHYDRHVDQARALLAIGESAADDRLDVRDLAACTAVASLILNLDEAVTKE